MDSPGRLWPRADLRVGDADREAVVDELKRHYVEGRLTSEELGERVALALNAVTFADLAVQLADLPPIAYESRVPAVPSEEHVWDPFTYGPRLGALVMMIGLMALVFILMAPGWHYGWHMGIFPFWPVLIWGVFFVGRARSGSRRR